MSGILDFLTDWRAILQIVILFSVIYLAMHHLRNSHGSLVLAGLLMALAFLWSLSLLLDLEVLTRILEMILGSLLLMLMIIFQPELRRALARLGSLTIWENRRRRELIGEVITAVQNMAKRKCGALIVIECKERLQPLIDDSIILDAKVNNLMLESIFYPNSPLHDGAVIIRDDRVVAARAILPLSRSENISRQLGTRHRAALGIAEESDAVTVLVSEESGSVSIAHGGKLYRDLSLDELHKMLDTLVVQKDAGELDETIRQINEGTNENVDLPEVEK